MPSGTGLTVKPLDLPNGPKLGAQIEGADFDNLTEEDFKVISDALFTHHIVLFKNQQGLTPKAQYELIKRFDPESDQYGHGVGTQKTSSILHPDLKTVPATPQVQIIGNGHIESYEGLENFDLKHPSHHGFHKYPVPESEKLDVTRFYRWHIDAALYRLLPPVVTTLLAVQVPKGRRQTLRYDDGTGDELDVPLGTTAFVSGETMLEILSPEQQEFAKTTRVQYAAHPYVWIRESKALSDGLGIHSEGLEIPVDELPPWEEKHVQILPMVWKNPVTGKLALQVHPCAIRKLHLKDGSVIDDLAKVRKIVHDLQRPGIAPKLVYAHDWEEGDLVLFSNRTLLHTVTGQFDKDEVRLFRQANLAASKPILGPDDPLPLVA